MIVVASGGSHHKGSASQPTKTERRDLGLKASGNGKPKPAPPRPAPQQSEYVVQTGRRDGGAGSAVDHAVRGCFKRIAQNEAALTVAGAHQP